jgi:hypothetical protein
MWLIVVPGLIAIAVTVIRAIGEVNHWPKPLVNPDLCGKAILGVVWLVPIFGALFAWRLVARCQPPKSLPFVFGCALVALALKLVGTYLMETSRFVYGLRIGINLLLTGTGLVTLAVAWPALFKVLFAYGYISRIPVAVVQFLALRGHWGTHYDALGNFPPIGFWPTYVRVSLVPNVFFMEAYTVIVGSLVGSAFVAVMQRLQTLRTGKSPVSIGQ